MTILLSPVTHPNTTLILPIPNLSKYRTFCLFNVPIERKQFIISLIYTKLIKIVEWKDMDCFHEVIHTNVRIQILLSFFPSTNLTLYHPQALCAVAMFIGSGND